jgi:hypothetical protein
MLSKNPMSKISILFVLTYLAIAFFNYGFIGVDEYWVGITRYLPANGANINNLTIADDVKSPTQLIPFYAAAKLAETFGAAHPFNQYRAMLVILALIAGGLYIFAARVLFSSQKESWIFLLLMLAHFCGSFILTRPMFESLAAPWLLLAFALAFRYWQDPISHSRDLYISLIPALFAFWLRPQTLFAIGSIGLLPLFLRQWFTFAKLLIVGILILAISGLPDLWLRGSWHYSLFYVFKYNVEQSANYNVKPWYFFLPILFLLAYGPFWLTSLKKITSASLKKWLPLWLGILTFTLGHMLFKHKYERFMFPVFPISLVLLVPLVRHWWEKGYFRSLKVRLALVAQFALWIPIQFAVPQGHLIDIVHFLEGHPAQQVQHTAHSIEWLPFALSTKAPGLIKVNSLGDATCEMPLIALESEHAELSSSQWKIVERFAPNVFEKIAFKFNPKSNIRRQALVFLECQ